MPNIIILKGLQETVRLLELLCIIVKITKGNKYIEAYGAVLQVFIDAGFSSLTFEAGHLSFYFGNDVQNP